MSRLRHWLSTWMGTDHRIADPKDWFYNAQQSRMPTDMDHQPTETWVWDLPPAAALHALEELGTARIKRHGVLRGVVIIPMLLQHEWFRRFSKTVDFYFIVTPGSIPEWPIDMHKSLTVGIYLPLFRSRPWDWKRVPFLVQFGSALSKMHTVGDPTTRDILRQFWIASSRIDTLPKRLVCDMLQDPSWRRFLHLSGQR
jgi:hypothetical protein